MDIYTLFIRYSNHAYSPDIYSYARFENVINALEDFYKIYNAGEKYFPIGIEDIKTELQESGYMTYSDDYAKYLIIESYID